jgi:long-chain acyl-CoA synthetase
MNLPKFFFRKSKDNLDKNAFIIFRDDTRKELTYHDAVESVIRYVKYLSDKVERGDRIVLCAENRPEWCCAYLAIVTVGGIAVPIDTELGADEIRNLVRASESTFGFYSDYTADKMKASEIPGTALFNFDTDNADENGDDVDLSLYLSGISPDDLASIIYTSGTTGLPKGVMLTHKNFFSNAMAMIDTGIISENDNMLAVLPLHHTFAFMCTFLVPLFVGAVITYPSSLKGPELTYAMKEAGVTILAGVPQLLDLFYSAIMRKIEELPFIKKSLARGLIRLSGFMRRKTGINLGMVLFGSVHERFGNQFRVMASGGASLSAATMKGLEALGFTVLEGYGLTETSPGVTFNPLKKRKPGSVGVTFKNVTIRIDKEVGDTEGEVVIKGENVMKGYYHMDDETDKVLRDGWFYSGDLGYMDGDGYLFLTGRKKEIIVLSSGKNIYPEEIEMEYQKIPLVKEVCVLEKKEGGHTTLHGFILPDLEYAKASKIANLHEALKWDIHGVSLKLPSYMRIKGFTLSSEPFPRTRLGKLQRFKIRDTQKNIESSGGQKKESIKAEEMDDVEKKVVRSLALFVHEGTPITLSDNLELDLGIDSLKRVALAAELEKVFSVKLPEIFMVDIQSVSDICDKLKEENLESSERSGKGRSFKDLLLQKPDDDQIKSIGLSQGILARLFVWTVLKGIKLFYRLYFRSNVKGLENIPTHPFILVSNHASYLDAFMIGSHVPFKVFRGLFFQGAQKYFQTGLMKVFAKLAHVIPIDPDAYIASAFSISAYVLNEKRSLCIFPEGGRSFDGSVMSFRKGIGLLASERHVPIVPARLYGTYESMPRGSSFPGCTTISLIIGEPVGVDELKALQEKGGDHYQAIADLVKERVEKL